MHLRLFLAASALALLSGCTGPTPHEALGGQGDAQTRKTHRQQLSKLDAQQVDDKVDIRTPCDSGSGALLQLQRQDYCDIRLSGPLGRGAARLTGREGAASLEVTGQGRCQAESPEALLEEQLGWHLPISHLLWWIRGLPAPDSEGHLTLNAGSRLTRLGQDGWQIEYTRYAEQNGYWLPKRLKLHGQNSDVTLVIED